MHSPRIFTSPLDYGYTYSGTASTAYKDTVCAAIRIGSISHEDFLDILRRCVLELRETFEIVAQADPEVADLVARMAYIESLVDDERARGSESQEGVVRQLNIMVLLHHCYDALCACVAATCNHEMLGNPDFVGRGMQLQMAKGCAILVNIVSMVHCFANDADPQAHTEDVACDKEVVSNINLSLNTYLNTKCIAIVRCLNPALSAENQQYGRSSSRIVRHNAELLRKVAELVDPSIPHCFRHYTQSCFSTLSEVIDSCSAECEEILQGDEIACMRLLLSSEASEACFDDLSRYVNRSEAGSAAKHRTSACTRALIKAIGCLLLIYREYAASESANHPFACSIEQCIRILRDSVYSQLSHHEWGEAEGANVAHEVHLHIRRATDELHAIAPELLLPELLLSPHISGELHQKALCCLEEMSCAWKSANSEHFSVPEEGESSSRHPATSLSTEQATSVSTSAPALVCASSVLEEARISSPRSSRTPSGDIEPPVKRARSA
ncbi:putative hGE-14 protein [Anaplasma phagocytophilum str. ApMUC09]|uniref:Putative hGE-14 protein n=1 Tax=Anaplasma phagocytophilum str. ApMUC09 TaxID=1359152 RepID=A0A0F3N9Z2_ANAPH|nr:putative hGE-14 protein [Anaplasma phagocytophilum str. ApMUC09]